LSSIDALYHNGYKNQDALFAAGFLFGLVRGAGVEAAGRLGALAAAEVIQHIGARPRVSLKELAKENGLRP
jgi:adenosine kinase